MVQTSSTRTLLLIVFQHPSFCPARTSAIEQQALWFAKHAGANTPEGTTQDDVSRCERTMQHAQDSLASGYDYICRDVPYQQLDRSRLSLLMLLDDLWPCTLPSSELIMLHVADKLGLGVA